MVESLVVPEAEQLSAWFSTTAAPPPATTTFCAPLAHCASVANLFCYFAPNNIVQGRCYLATAKGARDDCSLTARLRLPAV
eukprot:SAG11_NODE_3576_length_2359_cov_1.436283_1_plen_81_part_00